MPKKDEIVVGLDLGTTKVCAVVAERAPGDELRVLGVGIAPCRGIKQGMVVSIDDTGTAITQAVNEAEEMSGVEIHQVVAGIGGAHLHGINNRTTVGVKGSSVTPEDIEHVLDAVRAVELSRDDEIIHVTPQRYILDSQDAIADPVGIAGDRLSVEAHIITGPGTTTQNLTRCIERANLAVEHLVPQPLASAHAVLSPEELELGVALVDIGGGTTDLAVFAGGGVCHTWVLPLGGHHVTNDISYGLATPLKEAERIKVQMGAALAERIGTDELLEVPSVGGRPPRNVARRLLAEITEARMEEILTLVTKEIQRTGLAPHIGSGLVLTGGGSLPTGTLDLAERITGLSPRRGVPTGLVGLTELAGTPQNATAVGLARYALEGISGIPGRYPPDQPKGRFRTWVKEFF